ncbi:unnamed protein product [Allacma fusca]|uniref:Uncharacterized protein n=1 Tax=Allacma fusca TaxID=39272 RepID=A0A8J2NU84_9HEXA|nr:unnamed protein product [Allacma fusca]
MDPQLSRFLQFSPLISYPRGKCMKQVLPILSVFVSRAYPEARTSPRKPSHCIEFAWKHVVYELGFYIASISVVTS